jgi:hypothetical protein
MGRRRCLVRVIRREADERIRSDYSDLVAEGAPSGCESRGRSTRGRPDGANPGQQRRPGFRRARSSSRRRADAGPSRRLDCAGEPASRIEGQKFHEEDHRSWLGAGQCRQLSQAGQRPDRRRRRRRRLHLRSGSMRSGEEPTRVPHQAFEQGGRRRNNDASAGRRGGVCPRPARVCAVGTFARHCRDRRRSKGRRQTA